MGCVRQYVGHGMYHPTWYQYMIWYIPAAPLLQTSSYVPCLRFLSVCRKMFDWMFLVFLRLNYEYCSRAVHRRQQCSNVQRSRHRPPWLQQKCPTGCFRHLTWASGPKSRGYGRTGYHSVNIARVFCFLRVRSRKYGRKMSRCRT